MTDSHQPGTVPQPATSLLALGIEALSQSDGQRPVADWLREQATVGASARRQVSSLLRFLGLVDDAGRLKAETAAWRADRGLLARQLARSFRAAYAAAGCDAGHADLIGNEALGEEALRKLLKDEPPFKKLRNRGTRENALRFACHVHQAIAANTLLPPGGTGAGPPSHGPPSDRSLRAVATSPAAPVEPPAVRDLGTIVNPQRYRVARLGDDAWVYGLVHFELPPTPEAPSWLAAADPAEQARWLEQLAGSLLHAADVLRGQCPMAKSQ